MLHSNLASAWADRHNLVMLPKVKGKTLCRSMRGGASIRNPLASLLGYQLRRASQVIVTDLAALLADLDLTIAEMSVLVAMEANPGITQSATGRLLAIQRANMVPLVARLEKLGLISKSEAVGRARGVHMTQAGALVVQKCFKCIEQAESHFMTFLTEAQRTELMRNLRAVWQ